MAKMAMVRIPDGLARRLRNAGAGRGATMPRLVAIACEEWLERQEEPVREARRIIERSGVPPLYPGPRPGDGFEVSEVREPVVVRDEFNQEKDW